MLYGFLLQVYDFLQTKFFMEIMSNNANKSKGALMSIYGKYVPDVIPVDVWDKSVKVEEK